MTSVSRNGLRLGVACLSLWLFTGCGGTNSVPMTATNDDQSAPTEQTYAGLPTVAIPGLKPAANKSAKPAVPANAKANAAADPEPAKEPEKKPPQKGSPEWLLEQIQRIKAMPLPGSEPASDAAASKEVKEEDPENEPEEKPDIPLTADEEQKLKEQFEKSKAVRRERSLQIVKLAELCIAGTAKQPDLEYLFDAAVHYLLDARLQLALQGDSTSIEALYEAAQAFYTRKPESVAAVESELTLVNLTHACALRYGQTQPKWLHEFSKHSQLFATRFPEEAHRSVALLAAAARSCEVAGLTPEATSCYSLLLTNFKDTPRAQQAAGVVRRLQLKGKPLDLVGPTMEGDDLDIKSYRGKMVVIVFWATHARPFVEQLPKLQATLKKYEKYSAAVGVNLDADPNAVEMFMEKSGMTWPQIFSPNRALRGWSSPLAVHYGINNLPTIWLIDPKGVVADTTITAENLATRMHEVYLPFLKSNSVKPESTTNKPDAAAIKPASGSSIKR